MTSEPAAFEVAKGERTVRLLSEAEVARHLDLAELLDELESGFRQLELGQVQSPPRPEITIPDKGFSLTMSAWQPGAQICVKVVNVFDGNLAQSLPNHLAVITLFDPDNGAATCVMDATYLTGVRTAASAVLSVRLLARADARVATIVGAGVQARGHLRLLPSIRAFDRINVCSLEPAHAGQLAAQHELAEARTDLEAAVRESDVVCLTTHSAAPVIDVSWVAPGTHVTSVGYHPPDGELPRELARDHRVFVETLDALAPPPVGCSDLSHADRTRATTLGAVVLDPARGRVHAQEVTVYKAMGIGMEDMVAANLAYTAALQAGPPGQVMIW
jgi:ornithine cyclodeaminase/alanine dehydrogenase-like protein (mu-crystallin family)